MSGFVLDDYLEEARGLLEARLQGRMVESVEHLGGAASLEVHQAALWDGVMSGGKRVRPILCVAAWQICQAPTHEVLADVPVAVLDLAVSLEFIHAYSLMHDDLPSMDDAPLRRGRPTPHTVHGVEEVTRVAALLIPMGVWSAWEAGGRLHGPATGHAAARTLCRAAGAVGMVGGQALDLASESLDLSEPELTDLHARKTGALLAASLELGAQGANAPRGQHDALAAFGRALGLAFQIADDVLDRTASEADLGKKPSDAELAKSTYVSVLGVEGARARARMEIDRGHELLRRSDLRSSALEGLAEYIVRRTH